MNNFSYKFSGISLFWAIALHSVSIIGFQIVLMRILSVMQWYHFAFMIITIAMLGFGVSGTILALTKQKLVSHSEWLTSFLMLLTSVLMLFAYRISQNPLLSFDTFLVFSSPAQLLRLVLFLFLFFLPFLTASLALGILYVRYVQRIGRLYFANLFGSGLGGLAALIILYFFVPEHALTITASFPALAALLIFPSRKKLLLILLFTFFILATTWNFVRPIPPALSQYKGLSQTLLLPDANISARKSGISSLAEIVESSYLRYAPGLSLHFTDSVPVKALAFINGDPAGFIPQYNKSDTSDILDYTTCKLPYLIFKPSNVAVAGAGTGILVAQALRKGADKVIVTESDISLVGLLREWEENNYPSVYSDPKVELFNTETRTFFATSDDTFDLIVLPSQGSFGGTSGLQAIKEEFSFTTEAFESYWNKLSDSGLISVTVYTDFPPRALLKLTATFIEMLKNNEIKEPKKYIIAIRSWTTITFTVSKAPVDKETRDSVRHFCAHMGFDPFLLPDIDNKERIFYNYIEDENLFTLTDLLFTENYEKHINDYIFYIAPATDNKPYFSRFIKMSRIKDLLKEYGHQDLPFVELGYIIVWLTFIISFLFSLLFIILPIGLYRKSKGKLPVLFYFGAIGLGFMFAEIILIQRFVLYLGHAVYSVSAVLSIMLLASGVGSYFSSKLKINSKGYFLIFIIIAVIFIIYALWLTPLLRNTAGMVMPARIALTSIIIALPAFFMGMPFPLGLSTLSENHKDKLAWAWGINGFFSVIAVPMALIIAIETGSVMVISIASVLYLIAFISLYFMKRTT